tara:strand:+ start:336 stop:1511 length:1176 start_codon:yes stop_codon:yes gene_type:complete
MANRNRVIYQSEGLYVSKNAANTTAANHEQLERVQSANYSYTINRQDVNQYGELARLDSIVLDPPTVNVDFSYLLTDSYNERALGFFVQQSGTADALVGVPSQTANAEGNFASGHMVAHSGVNVFIVTSPDGIDLNKDPSEALDASDTIIGIGNCYISDYSVDLSVGALPTASVTMEGANMNSNTSGTNFASPAINQEDGNALPAAHGMIVALPNPSQTPGGAPAASSNAIVNALRPGDITLDFSNVSGETIAQLNGAGANHVQSVSLSLPLSRTPIQRLGSKFPFARAVDFPVNVSLSASAILNDTEHNNLANVLESGAQTISINMKDSNGNTAIRYHLKEAKLDSESFSSSIGANKSVDLTFSAQVGGPEDQTAGLFMSGYNGNKIFQA